MSVSRRQFLIAGGATLGVGTSVAVSLFSRQPQRSLSAEPSSNPLAKTSTHPAPKGLYAPQRGDVRLVVMSDMNSAYGSTTYLPEVEAAVKMLPDWQPDLVLCAGDMVAGQSKKLSRQQIQAMWTAFDQKVLDPIRQTGLPFALTLGNHDASSYRGPDGKFVFALDRDVSNQYWNQEDIGLQFVDRAKFPFYYSFKQNDIFYLVWDASSATVSEQEWAWADLALASPAAQQAKMRIVMGHLPFYAVSQGRDRPGEILNKSEELRMLLEKHRVHTYISGHQHAYFPGRVGELEMLQAGALGSGPRRWIGSDQPPFQTLTVVDIDLKTQATAYTTYNMNTLQVVNINQVPRTLVGPSGREIRRDLTLADLTAAEQDQQYIPKK
ncbi:MAG: metallophosphoesterase family protein [Thermosynechococcaceae cyanobacterium]